MKGIWPNPNSFVINFNLFKRNEGKNLFRQNFLVHPIAKKFSA